MSYSLIEPYMTNRTKANNKVKSVSMTDAFNQGINSTLDDFDSPNIGDAKINLDRFNQGEIASQLFNKRISNTIQNPLESLTNQNQRNWSNQSSAAGQSLNDAINDLTGTPARALATAASNMAPNTYNNNPNSEKKVVIENNNQNAFNPLGELPGTKSFGTSAAFDNRLQLMDLIAKLGLMGDRTTQDYVRGLGRIDRAEDKGIAAIEDAMQRRGMTNSGVRNAGMGRFLGEALRSRGDWTNKTSRRLQDLLLQQGLGAEQSSQRFVDRDALKSFLSSVAASANVRGV